MNRLIFSISTAILIAPITRADGTGDAAAGRAALNGGHYAEAARLLTKALAEDLSPIEEERAYVKRGEAYLGEKQYSRALDDLNTALSRVPDDREAADARTRVLAGAAQQASRARETVRLSAASPLSSEPRLVSIRDRDGNIYKGTAIGKNPEGEGIMRRANGDVFEGTFHDGDYVAGRYAYADGDQYTGRFQDNDPSDGTYTWADGTVYTGTFVRGQPNGSGTFTYPDGRRYTGEVRNGLPEGQGTMVHPGGRTTSGWWRGGRPLQ